MTHSGTISESINMQDKINRIKEENIPDPAWKGLYKAGGISAILYVILALVVPIFMVVIPNYDFEMNGPALLEFIGGHKTWWMILQSLVLESSILAIITFVALYMALKHINRSYALIGTLITVVCNILFMAYYPVLLGLTYLSDQYAAAGEPQRQVLATAAEALIAQNNAFNPVYESLFAVGIMILGIVMLKSSFPRWLAWMGIAMAPVAIIAMSLWSVINIGYLWWWVLFTVWFAALGWKLFRQFGN